MTKWLDRSIAKAGPYLALCLSQDEFQKAMSHLKAPEIPMWISSGANATMHTLYNDEHGLSCIVCMDGHQGRDPIEVAGLLIHESVHVWQQYCESIGERSPGVEQEAYAIQSIAQELMAEFARRMR